MASFAEAPPGDPKVGEKIFKTKCAQCHTVDKGAGHKQGNSIISLSLSLPLPLCVYFLISFVILEVYISWLCLIGLWCVWIWWIRGSFLLAFKYMFFFKKKLKFFVYRYLWRVWIWYVLDLFRFRWKNLLRSDFFLVLEYLREEEK
jgi:hypothetical protein